MRVAMYSAAFILLSASFGLRAEQLSCSNSAIQEILKSEARDALLQTARLDPSTKLSEDEFRIGFEDAYEKDRTDFTRSCAATLLFSKDLGDSLEVTYNAIQTESGKFLVQWPGHDSWGKAAYLDIIIKNGIDEVRKRHPDLPKEELYRIYFYGEPGEHHNDSIDAARRAAEADPGMNTGSGGGVNGNIPGSAPRKNAAQSSTLRQSQQAPATPRSTPYAADPNWDQWHH